MNFKNGKLMESLVSFLMVERFIVHGCTGAQTARRSKVPDNLMKPEESAECPQTLSSQVGSGHKTSTTSYQKLGGAWKRDEKPTLYHVRRHLANLIPRPSPRPPCMYRTEGLGTRLLQSCLPEVWSGEEGFSLATTKQDLETFPQKTDMHGQ